MTPPTKPQLIEYLTDCQGYSGDQDLEDKTLEELKELITNWDECLEYLYIPQHTIKVKDITFNL